jgi:DNA-binding SARP family transcriptional activator
VVATEIRLLGGFEARMGGVTLRLPRNAQRLLAYLAFQDTPAPRTHVAGTLWCDVTDDSATASLRTAVWRVRRVAGDLLNVTPHLLSLAPDVRVDLHRVKASAREIATQGLPPGSHPVDVDLLAGELLPGWYDDWVVREQEDLRHLCLQALDRAARDLVAVGRMDEALEVALAVTRADPLRESAHRTLILVHLRAGNRVEALRQYGRLELLLSAEFGISPSQELRELLNSAEHTTQLSARRASASTAV